MAAATQTDRLPFNKHVLKWARLRRGRTYEEAAKRASVTVDKIIEWENPYSSVVPTVRQARLLAEEYSRPFLEFFADRIPDVQDVQAVPDFRLYADQSQMQDKRVLIEAQAWAETQRLNALDLYEILGDIPKHLPPTVYSSTQEAPEAAASRIRIVTEFSLPDQLNLPKEERDKIPQRLRSRLETLGILVFKEPSLKKAAARGICVYFDVLPIIVFGSESPGAQFFTIAHELAHIALRQSAISGSSTDYRNKSPDAEIERWCNSFAASFVIPEHIVATAFPDRSSMPLASIDDGYLTRLASFFGVSRHAMLVRLVDLKYVNADFYWSFKRPQFLQEEAQYESFGRPKYYGSRYRSSRGDLYTGLVLEAWATGRITNHNAAEFMEIGNLAHLEAIRAHFAD
jgi:Zn-dependent peptidase ImmA (M78 family)/transcriptional regulator with XRE-family HTH domain